MAEEIKQGMTRREVLKKGAMLGGTLMWVAPVVQAVGMSPAMAQFPSETSCCLKIEITSFTKQTVDTTGTENDLVAAWHVTNCSTRKMAYSVSGFVEMKPNPGTGADEWVQVDTEGFGNLDTGTSMETATIKNAMPGTYEVRAKATFICEGETEAQKHTSPSGAYFVYPDSVTVAS